MFCHLLLVSIAVIHLLAAAGGSGAMAYSLLVVQPRAPVFRPVPAPAGRPLTPGRVRT